MTNHHLVTRQHQSQGNRPRKRKGNNNNNNESKKRSIELMTTKYKRWEEEEGGLDEFGRFNLEREVMLRLAIFIFLYGLFSRLIHSKAVYPLPLQNTVASAWHCHDHSEHSRALLFFIYGYMDSIAQHSAATQVLYEYNSLTQPTRQYD
jgi:hypothetical protein